MREKIINILILLSAFFGYLEWGKNNSSFLYEVELEFFKNMFNDPKSSVHPFTVIPIFGQILLFITLFQKTPNQKLTYIGIFCIGVLLLFIFFIGIISINLKILISTLPFILFAILSFKHKLF